MKSNEKEVLGNLGANVRYARESMGWSQREVAERLTKVGSPANHTTVSRLELGARDPRLAELVALSKVFLLEPTWFTLDPKEFADLADLSLLGVELTDAREAFREALLDYEAKRAAFLAKKREVEPLTNIPHTLDLMMRDGNRTAVKLAGIISAENAELIDDEDW